ncbi:MAG: sulfotransferase domain-containing protein [Candidatus Heimdallarchaeota archaeon]
MSGTEHRDACGDQDRYATDGSSFQWPALRSRKSRRGSRKPLALAGGSSRSHIMGTRMLALGCRMEDWRHLWQKVRKKNVVLRKGSDWLNQISRMFKIFLVREKDFRINPPIIANSFPKSGTHLLTQILEPFPHVKSYGVFLASVPAIPHKFRSKTRILHSIRRIVPGELVRAHLTYEREYATALGKKNVVQFFIYRDPRDIVISETYFLTHMFRWHSLHRYFRALPTEEKRISFTINGASDPTFPYSYPNISERFRWYKGWIAENDILAIRFEDLVSEHRATVIKSMIEFYCAHCEVEWDTEKLLRHALRNIQPKRSHTFRQGKTGGWREQFTEKHKEQMKAVAGELIIELGYEHDTDW